jgi:hypothetical protein
MVGAGTEECEGEGREKRQAGLQAGSVLPTQQAVGTQSRSRTRKRFQEHSMGNKRGVRRRQAVVQQDWGQVGEILPPPSHM